MNNPLPQSARALFAIATLALLFGCETDSGGDSSKIHAPAHPLRTFAVTGETTKGPASDAAAPMRLAKPARDAATAAMIAKGYTEAPLETADLEVKLSAEFMTDLLSETTERRIMYIEIFDRHAKKRIWQDKRERSASTTMPPELVQKHITEMLAPFPSATTMPHANP